MPKSQTDIESFIKNAETSEMVAKICGEHDISYEDLLPRTRNKKLHAAREAIIKKLRYEAKLSLPQIGAILNRDHTAVLFLLRKIEKNSLGDTSPCPTEGAAALEHEVGAAATKTLEVAI